MSERKVFDDIETATVLKPGDRVLLVLDGTPDHAQMDEVRALLTKRFPGVEFTLASGIESVAVLPADADQKLIEEEERRG